MNDEHKARFASVVLPHLGEAYGLARVLTGNHADAEDVVQDACLRAFRGIHGYAEGNARAWVLKIVRHAAYTWLAKNRPTSLVAVDDLEAVEAAQASDGNGAKSGTPEAELIAKSDAAQLSAAIAALPPPFRETLVLRDIEWPRLPRDRRGDRRADRDRDVAARARPQPVDRAHRKGRAMMTAPKPDDTLLVHAYAGRRARSGECARVRASRLPRSRHWRRSLGASKRCAGRCANDYRARPRHRACARASKRRSG